MNGDLFGFALSMEGDRLAVGVRHDDQAGVDAGAVIVSRRDSVGWVFEAKLLPTNARSQQVFGCAVSLSGSRLAIGAWGLGQGATYVFVRNGTTWSPEALIPAPTGALVALFGERVSLSADRVAIGARSTDLPFLNTGAAFTYTRSGTVWNLETQLTSPNAQSNGEFGGAVALAGDETRAGDVQRRLHRRTTHPGPLPTWAQRGWHRERAVLSVAAGIRRFCPVRAATYADV